MLSLEVGELLLAFLQVRRFIAQRPGKLRRLLA